LIRNVAKLSWINGATNNFIGIIEIDSEGRENQSLMTYS